MEISADPGGSGDQHLYALPSLYPDEPAVQISGAKAGTQIDQSVIQKQSKY